MSLEDKLKEILKVAGATHIESRVAQIIEAFKSEGWIDQNDPLYIESANIVGRAAYKAGQLQSGQEFYDRFEKEANILSGSIGKVNFDDSYDWLSEYLDAAKRASGLIKVEE